MHLFPCFQFTCFYRSKNEHLDTSIKLPASLVVKCCKIRKMQLCEVCEFCRIFVLRTGGLPRLRRVWQTFEIRKLRRAIFAVLYNISGPNFGFLLILGCSFQLHVMQDFVHITWIKIQSISILKLKDVYVHVTRITQILVFSTKHLIFDYD